MTIVAISGKAQHGKDTTAGFLKQELEKSGERVLVAHYGDLVKYVCRAFFGWDGQKDEKGRGLLQRVGTDVVRSQDSDYWVNFIRDMLRFFPGEWDWVLIPDCRFPNEIDGMRDCGNVVHLRVVRPGFISPLTEEQQRHPSETALDKTDADYVVDNCGTLEGLQTAVANIVPQIKEELMNKRSRGYFDIEVDLTKALADNGMVDEMLYLKDLQQRKLFLESDIDQYSAGDVARKIMQFNCEDKDIPAEERKPIRLYIASNGGEVDAGFGLIDVICNSKTPVYTINIGYQYSMGFLIGLAGHKRYAMPNAKFLLHDGSNFVYNSGAKVQDQMVFNRKVEDRIKGYILSRTTITEEEYNKNFRVEWYMFADEAKDKGCVDFIVGVDCDMDEVV